MMNEKYGAIKQPMLRITVDPHTDWYWYYRNLYDGIPLGVIQITMSEPGVLRSKAY